MNPYLPGISNYCDRWCERCSMSHRCRLFSHQRSIEGAYEEPTAENLINQIERNLFGDSPFQGFKATDFILSLSDGQENPAGNLMGPRENYIDVEQHPLSVASAEYGSAIGQWIEHAGEELEWTARRLEKELQSDMSEEASAHDMVAFEEALEVISWYRFQIGIKLRRALQSQAEEALGLIFGPSDADGSSKVALIGIDRSLIACHRLSIDLPAQTEALDALGAGLESLRVETESTFPEARAFQRPGLD